MRNRPPSEAVFSIEKGIYKNRYAVQLLAAVAFALFVVAARANVSFLATKIGGEKVSLAMQLAATVVRALAATGRQQG